MEHGRDRITRLVWAAVLAWVALAPVPALSNSGIYNSFLGLEYLEADVANLELVDVDWVRIDGGERIARKGHRQIEVSPGRHHIEWCRTFGVSFLVDPSMSQAYVARENLTLEAGHTYLVAADRSHGQGYRAYLWIEDADSKDVVAGFKKPKRLLPGQANTSEYVPPFSLEHIYGRAGKGVYSKDEKIQRFFEAALAGNRSQAEALLNDGVDSDVRDRDGMTALLRAAIENHPKGAKLLLDLGADVNARFGGDDGPTPLILAAAYGHEDVVRLLLTSPEVDVNARSQGRSALVHATYAEESVTRELLLAHPDCDETVVETILQKDELVLALAEKVRAAGLPLFLNNSLLSKLATAYQADAQETYCEALGGFIEKVEAKKAEKIDREDANEWVSDANRIIDVACNNG